MTTRRQRVLSAHADSASVDRRLATFELPEGVRVHAYAHRAGHHHLVTDGRTGHELSLRVPIGPDLPLHAALALLQRLVAELAGRRLAPLHTVALSPPVLGSAVLGGVVLVTDRELGASVLQAVGITAVEARDAALSSSEPLVAALAAHDPQLVTLAHREALVLPAPVGAPRSEGHDVPTLEVSCGGARIDVEPSRLRPTLVAHLRARLVHGLGLRLRGPRWVVLFEPAGADVVELQEGRLRVGLGAAALEGLTRDAESGPLVLGPTTLHFLEELVPDFAPLAAPEVGETEPLHPFEARRMADEAAAEQRLEEALSLIPLAVKDGSHGLLAELLHIDLLRRLGRSEDARAQLWRTANAWLAGERPKVWNTQWARLIELAKKLKLDLDDPRLVRARTLAR